MSRNFEEEYIKSVKSDIPDLWSRIEAAVDEDIMSKRTEMNSVPVTKVQNYQTENTTAVPGKAAPVKNKKKRNLVMIYTFTGIGAAAILLLVIGVRRLAGNVRKYDASPAMALKPQMEMAAESVETDAFEENAYDFEDVETSDAAPAVCEEKTENRGDIISRYNRIKLGGNAEDRIRLIEDDEPDYFSAEVSEKDVSGMTDSENGLTADDEKTLLICFVEATVENYYYDEDGRIICNIVFCENWTGYESPFEKVQAGDRATVALRNDVTYSEEQLNALTETEHFVNIYSIDGDVYPQLVPMLFLD